MFGVKKCFGGSHWGVIATFEDYELTKKVCEALAKSKGGLYNPVNMNDFHIPNDKKYIEEKFGVDLSD